MPVDISSHFIFRDIYQNCSPNFFLLILIIIFGFYKRNISPCHRRIIITKLMVIECFKDSVYTIEDGEIL